LKRGLILQDGAKQSETIYFNFFLNIDNKQLSEKKLLNMTALYCST